MGRCAKHHLQKQFLKVWCTSVGRRLDDAQSLRRVEVTGQEWKSHWQVETPEEFVEHKPWRNEALQELEEAFRP